MQLLWVSRVCLLLALSPSLALPRQEKPDPKPAPKFTVTAMPVIRYETHEGREWFLASVVLEGDPGKFTVVAKTLDLSAIGGCDFLHNESTLEFAGYSGEKQYFVCLVEGDKKPEEDEEFAIGLFDVKASKADPASFKLVPARAVILNDDDGDPIIGETRPVERVEPIRVVPKPIGIRVQPFVILSSLAAGGVCVALLFLGLRRH